MSITELTEHTELAELAAPATEAAEPQTFAAEYADPARYDLEYGQSNADLPFYASLAETSTGPVLDLACGTGRVALRLAEAGHAVTAVDVNALMLEHAQTKFGADDVAWVEQDARELQLRSKFGLVVMAGNAFQHLLSNEDRDAVLKAVYRQLKPGGTFAVALRFPEPTLLAHRSDFPEVWHTYLDAEGYEVIVSGTSAYDPISQVMAHQTYRHFAGTGVPAASPTLTHLRYHYPQELEAALKNARFTVEERFGGFDRTPLEATSTSLVYLCRKPESTRRS